MERSDRNFQLPPPPRMLPHGELQPIIEPPLRDLVPFPGSGVVEEWEPFEGHPAELQLTEEIVRRAQEAALTDERVKRLISGKRHIPIGASLLEEHDEKKEPVSLMFVIYNYQDNTAIEVFLDLAGLKVSRVAETRYQPPPVRQEMEQAITLARKDSRLSQHRLDDLEGNAILVSPADPNDPNYGHRQFDVRFMCPNERLPRFMALVDLSTETVLRAGTGCSDELKHPDGAR